MRRIIRNGSVVTMDPARGDLPRADILVEDGRIVAVGPDLGAEDAEVIDAAGQIVIPGFVNTHLHTWQHALRGVCADWTVKDYTRCWRVTLGPMYRPEDMRVGNYMGGLDSLHNGTTTVVDYCHNLVTTDHAYGALEGLRASGVRALFGYALTPVLTGGWGGDLEGAESVDLPDHDSRLAFARRLADEQFRSRDDLVRLCVVPQELSISELAQTRAEFALARELDARMTMHANQLCSPQPWRDIAVLDEAGLLGDDLLLVHCTFSGADELRRLADCGVHVSVAPETEMQMGMGVPITGELIGLGVAPTLGVDITSNHSGDMFAQMRLALQTARMVADIPNSDRNVMPDDVATTTREALAWATVNGARAAGVDDITGSITPGKQADLVIVDATAFNLAGWNRRDPVGTVVLGAHAGNVDTVLVGGRVVKRHGKLTHVDTAAAVSELEASQQYVREWTDAREGILPQPRIELSF